MSNDSIANLADTLARSRLVVQIAGVVLAVVGFFAARAMAEDNLSAQLSAGLAGVVLAAFAHYFQFLQRLAPEQRGSLARAGLASLGLCLVASVGSAGYFLSERSPADGSSRRSGRPPESAPTATAAAFSSANDHQIEIQLGSGEAKRVWSTAAVKVVNIWTLTPSGLPSRGADLPGDYDVELEAGKQTPYTVTSGLLRSEGDRVYVTLKPLLPAKMAKEQKRFDQLNLRNIFRLTFTKKGKGAKDFVFLLHLTLRDADGKTLDAGKFLYMPDLKTRYEGAASDENRDVLREINAQQGYKSHKLAELLKANAMLLDTKQ